MICPKCSFEQPDEATDCARCGVIFARHRPAPGSGTNDAILPVEPLPPAQYFGDTLPPPPVLSGLDSRRTFELGSILAETFQTYFANFLPFVLLTALAFAPVIAYEILYPTQGLTWTWGVTLLLQLLCGPLATATITFGVFQQMRGRDTNVSDCLKVGLSNLLPVIGVAILQGLAIGLGAIFCVIPGLIVATMLAVSVPVAIEERSGTIAALNRSSELTEGYRWHVFGVLFILGLLVAIGVGLILGVITLALASIPTLALLIREVTAVITSGLSATAAAVMYYRLRSVKESIDVESIASVFD